MPFLYNSKTTCNLKKYPKCNSSPKSVKTYINQLQIDYGQSDEKIHSKPQNIPNDEKDPTNLNNILNSLKDSSKGGLPYPQSFNEHNDATEEVCDFKNVGNVTSISFIEDNSFAETEEDDNYTAKGNEEDILNISQNVNYCRLSEERMVDEKCDDEDINIFKLFKKELTMGQIHLEQERVNQKQTQSLQRRREYLKTLSSIRNKSFQNLCNIRAEFQSTQKQEQCRADQLREISKCEVDLILKNYMDKVIQMKKETLKEVEAVNLQEEERELKRKNLLESLYMMLEDFKNSLEGAKTLAQGVNEESDLRKILFKELPSILDTTVQTYSKMSPSVTTETEISIVSKRVVDAIKVLQDIHNLLVERAKQEKKSIEENLTAENTKETTPQTPSNTNQNSPNLSQSSFEEPHQVKSTPSNNPPPDYGVNSSESQNVASDHRSGQKIYFEEAEKRFRELKEKFNHISQTANEARENTQLRPLLSRAVGVVNTLNNEKHDTSNRGKLQQILNLINGRSCTIGSDTVSTSNNPSAQAFVKEQFAMRVVSLGHDKQVASMGIYASLIVRLWSLYPDVGELVLFKLYETCPFLVPLSIKRDSGQTDEEFNRSIGIRHKEGGVQEAVDKYLTRMGAAAQLYGRIVSMEIENHPHGIEEGWKWMARTLSNPPHPSITGALLCGFLSTAGIPLLNHYGKQFRKMLHFLYVSYLPHIEKDVLEGGHSDVVALKSLLEKYHRTNALPAVADGYRLLL